MLIITGGQSQQAAAPKQEVKVQQPSNQQPQQQQPAPKQPDTPKTEDKSQSQPQAPQPQAQQPAQASTGSCSGGEAAGGDPWTTSTCSGTKSILDTFNELRGQWDSSLKDKPYTWSTKLAKNAHDTAWDPSAMNKANVMGHKLFDGSMGQCFAGSSGKSQSSDSAFAAAVKMWICEIPGNSGLCKEQTKGIGEHPTGHAEIIKDPSKTQCGCYGMWKNNDASTNDYMYVCDFA